MFALMALRAAPFLKARDRDKTAKLRVAQRADPERACEVADIGDDAIALGRWRHAPLARDDPAHAILVADHHRTKTPRRDIAAFPDIAADIGRQRLRIWLAGASSR